MDKGIESARMQHRLGSPDLSSVTSRLEQCTSVRQNGCLTTENTPEKSSLACSLFNDAVVESDHIVCG